ncbi:hypothetical protein SCALIN_C04_0066 [Candidatus Scalindua japonica]|uniref:Methionine synthase n=1 Tax=Candidatus Scalindua japonica TaxID=1284222 RepID=A0A286TUL9_9BACT|nr:hypothetical protein SCALIN_C04_0066 [Candidatus Scalindua japonica]
MFNGNFSATAIGSYPHNNVEDACNLILRTLPEVPCWPQLPERDMREEMLVQYTEGLPFLKIDQKKKSVYIDMPEDSTDELEKFYYKFLSEDPGLFPISDNHALGFSNMVNLLKEKRPESLRAIKGQIVGPITLAGSLKSPEQIAVLHNPVLFDVIVKLLTMKACWQLDQYSEFGLPRIIFLDEPYLSSYGSAFASLKKEQIVESLNEIFLAIHNRDSLSGIHCCGNTDWTMLMETQVDIINFDAFGYMDTMLIYKNEVRAFLERGGILAWGIVPTTDSIKEATIDDLMGKMVSAVDTLTGFGIDRKLIIENSLITPSCGTGTMPLEEAEKAMTLTHQLTVQLKDKYNIT